MHEWNLLTTLIRLELDPSDYAIMGTGALISYALPRQIYDLDVLVRGEAWDKVRSRPDAEFVRGALTGDEVVKLHGGLIEFSETWVGGSTTAELIARAELIRFEDWGSSHDLRFATLADSLEYKKEFNRTKDLADVNAILEMHALRVLAGTPLRPCQCPDSIVIATATTPRPPAPINKSRARCTIRYFRNASPANLRTSSACTVCPSPPETRAASAVISSMDMRVYRSNPKCPRRCGLIANANNTIAANAHPAAPHPATRAAVGTSSSSAAIPMIRAALVPANNACAFKSARASSVCAIATAVFNCAVNLSSSV